MGACWVLLRSQLTYITGSLVDAEQEEEKGREWEWEAEEDELPTVTGPAPWWPGPEHHHCTVLAGHPCSQECFLHSSTLVLHTAHSPAGSLGSLGSMPWALQPPPPGAHSQGFLFSPPGPEAPGPGSPLLRSRGTSASVLRSMLSRVSCPPAEAPHWRLQREALINYVFYFLYF